MNVLTNQCLDVIKLDVYEVEKNIVISFIMSTYCFPSSRHGFKLQWLVKISARVFLNSIEFHCQKMIVLHNAK